MSNGYGWFTPDEAETSRFYAPGALAVAKELRENRTDEAEVAAFLEANSFEATFRELTGADQAKLTELRISDAGEVGFDIVESARIAVAATIVSWTLEPEPTLEAIKQLPQVTIQEMFQAIPDRHVTLADFKRGRANGSGPPTTPAATPAISAPAEDAATPS